VARGFEPTVTYSSHMLLHPVLDRAVREFLERERDAVEQHVTEARRDGVLKPFVPSDTIGESPSSE
jgi:hypothetical protein